MAQTPERKVKDAVVALLKQHNVYHFSPPSNGFGRAGIPDIIACFHGRFMAIECKAGKNKPTALQVRELERIALARGVALLINENNISDLVAAINKIKDEQNGNSV